MTDNSKYILLFSSALAGAIAFSPAATAQPIVPAADGTGTVVTPDGDRFDITGGTNSGDGANLFHSFTEFGLDRGQIANFVSRPDILNILARINGGNVSYINGLIQVTGGNSNLYLMNPAGIVFGANASLNVPAAFTATTANGIGFGNNWFNAIGNNNYSQLIGTPTAFAFTMPQPGNIINSGNLAVGLGQDLLLLGGNVINTGNLNAPQGQITIASVPGQSTVRLSQPGFVLNLDVQPPGLNTNKPNDWTLPITSLPQMLTGGSGGNATGVTVNPDGTIKLTGSGINIFANTGTTIVSGNVNASSTQTGGTVQILGDKVGVLAGNINADGNNRGGRVLIGGDFQGKGTIPNASQTVISQDSTIAANANNQGDGGKVIVWADQYTGFYGNILARGGKAAGNGGFVEVSGKELLIFNGMVDAGANAGNPGTLLLDPKNITIGDSSSPLLTLLNPNPVSGGYFGQSVAAVGSDLLVGAPGNTVVDTQGTAFTGAGQAFLFNSNGNLLLTLNNPNPIDGGAFGHSVAAAGNNLLIGAYGNEWNGGTQVGQAFLFNSNGNLLLTLNNPNPVHHSWFGQSVAVVDSNLLVAARGNWSRGVWRAGQVFLFNSSGNLLLTLDNPNPADFGYFGTVVAPAGSNLLVSAYGNTSSGGVTYTGQVFLFNSSGNLLLTLDNPNPVSGRRFGSGVAAVGNSNLLVGVYDPLGLVSGERQYLFNSSGDLLLTFDSPSYITHSYFGNPLLAVGSNLLVGAPGNTSAGVEQAGQAFLFSSFPPSFANNPNLNNTISFNDITTITNTGTDMVLQANNDITVNQPIITNNPTGNGGAITLQAGRSILVNANITTDNSNLNLIANETSDNGVVNAERDAGDAVITIPSGVTLDSGSGDITITLNNVARSINNASADITLSGTINAKNLSISNDGNTILNGTFNVNNLTTDASGTTQIANNITTINSQTYNDAVRLNNSVTLGIGSSINGNVNFNSGNGSIIFSQGLDAGSNQLTLRAGEIDFLGTIKGNNNLILEPATPTQNIILGGSDNGTTALDITSSDITALQPGFTNITIGRTDGSGAITLAGNVTFNSPVTLQSPANGGSIDTTGFTLNGGNNSIINIIADRDLKTGNILNPGRAINLTSNNGIIDTSNGQLDTRNVSGNAGNLTIQSPTQINVGSINSTGNIGTGNVTLTSNQINFSSLSNSVKSKGDILLQPFTDKDNLTITSPTLNALADGFNSITIGRSNGSGIISTSSALTFSDPVTIQSPNGSIIIYAPITGIDNASITLTGTTKLIGDLTTANQNIIINGDTTIAGNITLSTSSDGAGSIIINGTIDGKNNLTLDTGTGSILLNGDVGKNTRLGNLTISSANSVQTQAITATSITQTSGTGTTTFGGELNTNTASGINLKGNSFTFSSAVTTTEKGGINIDNFGKLNIPTKAPLNLAGGFNQTGAGEIAIASNITTNNKDIKFSGPVTLNGQVNFNLGTAKIAFGSTLAAGDNPLTLTASEIDFGGKVTGNNQLILQPATASENIVIGATDNTTDALDLTSDEINQLQKGFSAIAIGRTDSSGAITIDDNVTFRSPITIQSPANGGSITAKGQIITDAGTLDLIASNNVITNSIITNGGNINITSKTGAIDTSAGQLDASSTIANGGSVQLNAPGNIKAGNIITKSENNPAGNINLTTKAGAIEARNLESQGNIQGGQITLISPIQITTKQINSSASKGNGGNITIDPQGDVQVDYINAQGGTEGTGGKVDITTASNFRAVGSFSDRNNITSSISTAGGTGGGSIILRHGGGATTAFNIAGNATTNGVVGNITSGNAQTVTPGSYFGPFTQGQTQIITTPGEQLLAETAPAPIPVAETAPAPIPVAETVPAPIPVAETVPAPIPVAETAPAPIPVAETAPAPIPVAEIAPPSETTPTPIPSADILPPERVLSPSEQVGISIDTQAGNVSISSSENIVPPGRNFLDITDILRERIAITLKTSKSDIDINAVIPQIEELRKQEYENYFEETISVNSNASPSLAEIQKTLQRISVQTGKKPAIFYVIVQPDTLQLVLVTPSGKSIYRSVPTADRDTLMQTVTEFRSQITDPAKRDTTSYLESAQKLYQWIIAPIESELQSQGIQTIAFSLDPKLRSVPLAALHDGEQFLVEKYSIALIPSVNLIDTRYRDIRKSQVLAMGASQFPNTDLSSLPAVPIELTTIANNIWEGKYFLDRDFTLANLQSESMRGGFAIIHLATHGSFQTGEPNQSYIQLWDSRITLDRLRQLRWNNTPVELLVLSACRTAFGDEKAELGFGGLAVASGVKSALASLWYVSDQGTLSLMTEFYEQLKIAPIKAEALRQAQIALIGGKVRIEDGKLRGVTSQAEGIPLPPELASQGDLVPSHPFYWAAFTLIGSPW